MPAREPTAVCCHEGMVKPGNTAHALYLVDANESVELWGFTERSRQAVTVDREALFYHASAGTRASFTVPL